MSALAIRDDIGSEELRRRARRERDGRVSARLIAIANALEGMDRASAARLAGMDRQTLRDWVHRYNAEGIAGLCNRRAAGRKPKLSEGQMAALKAVVLAGPDPAVDKVARWRIVDLCRWVEERWGVSYSETGMLRLLWSLDLSHRKTRPRHPQSSEKAQQGHCHGNRVGRAAYRIGCRDGSALLPPSSLPTRANPTRHLAVSPLHPELSRCRGTASRTRA
jgi:transposase